MKKRRIIAIITAVVMLLSVGTVNAFAAGTIEDAFIVNENLSTQKNEVKNYETLLAEIDSYVRSMPSVTDGHSEVPREEINFAIEQQFSGIASTRAYFYSDSVELANVLASYDGVSAVNLATIMYHGYLAQDDAADQTYRDAYRHSTWNFRATKALSSSIVRIYTIDYEWANQLVDIWQDYYSERYSYYYDTYYIAILLGAMDITTISTLAQADADDYICEYKSELQDACRNSYSTFCSTFTDANIMDWWNNRVGRDYGKNYSSYTPQQMFNAACNNDELILDDADAPTEQYYLWAYTNWWYTGS